ncbi:MAG: hypothetical protein WCR52_17770 [Bacteroidota bacterium]
MTDKKESRTFVLDGKAVEVPALYTHLVYSKYRKEIAAEYGLSEASFRRRLKKYNLSHIPIGYLDETNVLRIYLTIGWPCKFDP